MDCRDASLLAKTAEGWWLFASSLQMADAMKHGTGTTLNPVFARSRRRRGNPEAMREASGYFADARKIG